jgi:hypothetical protein
LTPLTRLVPDIASKSRYTLATDRRPDAEPDAARDFERLCLWLVERECWDRAEHLGANCRPLVRREEGENP